MKKLVKLFSSDKSLKYHQTTFGIDKHIEYIHADRPEKFQAYRDVPIVLSGHYSEFSEDVLEEFLHRNKSNHLGKLLEEEVDE